MEDERDLSARLSALRVLHHVVADLNTAGGLTATLQAVVDAVVSHLGFGVAAVNVVRADGDLEVAAVAGGSEVKRAMEGKIGARASWNVLLRMAEPWGSLRYLNYLDGIHPDVPRWVSDLPPHDDPDAWHPMDALLAPMFTPEGDLVGVLSVDLPHDRRRPGRWRRELLEMFAAQAAIAIDNARLRAEALHAVARLEAEQRALRASEESFRQAFDNAPSGMAMTSLREPDVGRMLRVNDALCRLLDYPERALRRMRLRTVVHPEDRAALDNPRSAGCREVRVIRRDGSTVWVSLRASVVPDEAGRPRFLLSHVEDIEDRRRHEQRLAHRASHDPLTGLTNRVELRVRLDTMLGSGAPLAVLFCDLDDFKNVNDQYGHHGGDAVLIEVAHRLRAGVRTEDTVARVGGDEFVVVAGGLSRPEADDLADRLAGAFVTPVNWEGHVIPISASFGVGWAAGDATPDSLLRIADQEMYKRKRVHAEAHRRAG